MFHTLLQLDGQLLVAIQGLHMAWLDPIVSIYTKLGDAGILWIALSIKSLVERARPWLDWPIVPLVSEKDPNSFPSGHTCAAFAASMIWVRTLPWSWGRTCGVVLAVLMGLSRLYVGVHYPSDVLVGAVIGTLCAWAAWKLYQLWENKRNRVL